VCTPLRAKRGRHCVGGAYQQLVAQIDEVRFAKFASDGLRSLYPSAGRRGAVPRWKPNSIDRPVTDSRSSLSLSTMFPSDSRAFLTARDLTKKYPSTRSDGCFSATRLRNSLKNIVRAPLLLLVDSLAGQYYDLVRLHEDDSGGLVVRVSVKPHNRTIPPDPVG